MAITDLTGTTWVFNDGAFELLESIEDPNISFISNGVTYLGLSIEHDFAGSVYRIYYDLTLVYENDFQLGPPRWIDPAYKTIKFLNDTSETSLCTFLETNATLQSNTQLTVDMSTLTGWASLSAGTHTLTVVAKATGYIDSDPSTGVQFMKGQRVDAPYIELGE